MSVSGLCELCQQREIVDGCERCGRLVCERHHDDMSGLCAPCLRELGRYPDDRERSDGVDTYRF